jgi:hypothetical protein
VTSFITAPFKINRVIFGGSENKQLCYGREVFCVNILPSISIVHITTKSAQKGKENKYKGRQKK